MLTGVKRLWDGFLSFWFPVADDELSSEVALPEVREDLGGYSAYSHASGADFEELLESLDDASRCLRRLDKMKALRGSARWLDAKLNGARIARRVYSNPMFYGMAPENFYRDLPASGFAYLTGSRQNEEDGISTGMFYFERRRAPINVQHWRGPIYQVFMIYLVDDRIHTFSK